MKTLLSAVLLSVFTTGCASLSQFMSEAPSDSINPNLTMMAVPETSEPESLYTYTKQVDEIFQEGPLQVLVRETSVQTDEVAIAITIDNTSDRRIRFYPTPSRLSTGTTEIEANLFFSDSIMTGSLEPDESRSGTLVFKSHLDSELDLTQVDNAHLILGQVVSMQSVEPDYINIVVSLAQ